MLYYEQPLLVFTGKGSLSFWFLQQQLLIFSIHYLLTSSCLNWCFAACVCMRKNRIRYCFCFVYVRTLWPLSIQDIFDDMCVLIFIRSIYYFDIFNLNSRWFSYAGPPCCMSHNDKYTSRFCVCLCVSGVSYGKSESSDKGLKGDGDHGCAPTMAGQSAAA